MKHILDVAPGDVFQHPLFGDDYLVVEALDLPVGDSDHVRIPVRVLDAPPSVNVPNRTVLLLSPDTVVRLVEQKAGSRTYVVGLPVVITVHDGGQVQVEVDLSEASDLGVDDDASNRYDREAVRADEKMVAKAMSTIQHTLIANL